MPSREDILSKMREVVAEALDREVEIADGTDIQTDLDLTSADLMDVVGRLEESFDVLIPIDELTQIRTAGELCAVIERQLGG